MKHIVIIGGGASGMVAAIYAAKNNKVTIIERNEFCGKKILVTGNGRCNYWNENQDISHYHSKDTGILEKIITKENLEEVSSFFYKIGIVPRIKDGYYYPYSNQAVSIKNALLLEAKVNTVEIITNVFVTEIIKADKFIINPSKENITADEIVLATGSKAAFKTGSDGSGYELAKALGHTIITPLPSLVQLQGEGDYFKDWDGIRCEASVMLYENDKKVKEQTGELQLTNYGISGICVFNLSGIISRGLSEGKKEEVKINFVPWLEASDVLEVINWIDKQNELVKSRTVRQLLEGFLNYKLVKVLLELSKIDDTSFWKQLTKQEKLALAQNIYSFNQIITGTNSFDKAQVCSGGIPLSEINPKTMESLKVPGLHLIGEILDVDGDCGGYNLGFAWISGMLVGKRVKK